MTDLDLREFGVYCDEVALKLFSQANQCPPDLSTSAESMRVLGRAYQAVARDMMEKFRIRTQGSKP